MKTAIANVDEEMRKDDWIMGEVGKTDLAKPSESSRIEDQYYRDYAMHWNLFVRGVDVKPYKNRDEAANALQAFASPNSPMKILLREIAKNTNLSAELESAGWWPWIKSFFVKKKTNETGGTEPEKAFRPLFAFIGKKDQAEKAPIDTYTSEMGKAFNKFNTVSESQMKAIAEEMASKETDPLEIKKRETAILGLTSSFNETPSGQELATLLQKPLARLKSRLGAGGKEQMIKMWGEQILPAAKEIEKGYPFDEGATEADLKNLTAFLAPGEGKLSKFFDDKLKNYFEESNGQYKAKENGEFQFTDEFVAYLNNAFALRKALYGTSPTPKFEYEFTLKAAKDILIEVTIDGQPAVKSEGTGSLKGSFPAAAGASETGVLINFGSSGTTSTSGSSTPPSNSTSDPATKSPPSTGGDPSGGKFPGTWGLFRFVDASSPQKQPGGEYALKYKSLSATIKPSGGDLFDKNIFRQVKAPQNFLK